MPPLPQSSSSTSTEGTLDSYSTEVFVSSSSQSQTSPKRTLIKDVPFSRSIGQLDQLEHEIKHHKAKAIKRAQSLTEKDPYYDDIINQSISSLDEVTNHFRYEQVSPEERSTDFKKLPPKLKIPLSPSGFRLFRKQQSIHLESQSEEDQKGFKKFLARFVGSEKLESKVQKTKSSSVLPMGKEVAKSREALRSSDPPLRRGQKATILHGSTMEGLFIASSSEEAPSIRISSDVKTEQKTERKLESSEGTRDIGYSGTLDEYSNSIFLDDEDSTTKEHSEFEQDEVIEGEASILPEEPPAQVTFNPLYNSRRMHNLLQSKKGRSQSVIPAESDYVYETACERSISHKPQNEPPMVTFENPVYRNPTLHQKLTSESVRWEVADSKIRRFFRRQSLGDILAIRDKVKTNPKESKM